MKNELVKSYRQEIYTDSRIVAEKFGKIHAKVVLVIDKLLSDLNDLSLSVSASLKHRKAIKIFRKKDSFYRGRNFKYYEMNRPAFSLLCMRFTGKKALVWQDKFNDAFYQMEDILAQQSNTEWITTREHGKQIRLGLTDEIKTFVDYATKQGSKSAKMYYVNITKMEYKALGLIEKNEKVSKDFRGLLNIMDLNHLLAAENVAKKALMDGMAQNLHYKDCYQLAKERVLQLADIMVIKQLLKD